MPNLIIHLTNLAQDNAFKAVLDCNETLLDAYDGDEWTMADTGCGGVDSVTAKSHRYYYYDIGGKEMKKVLHYVNEELPKDQYQYQIYVGKHHNVCFD